MEQPTTTPSWFERNATLLFRLLIGVCCSLLVVDLFLHKHGHFAWEEWFGFQAFYGFACFSFAVLAGKQLRRLLKRPEDYYDR